MGANFIMLLLYVIGVIMASFIGYLSILFYVPPVKRDVNLVVPTLIIVGLMSWIIVVFTIVSAIIGLLVFFGSLLIKKGFEKLSNKYPDEETSVTTASQMETIDEMEEKTGPQPPVKKKVTATL